MTTLVWLASYPKSGNTWVRILLANAQRTDRTAVDINNITDSSIASSRALLDEALGVATTNLTTEELATYRPLAYRHWARVVDQPFIKIHDGYYSQGTTTPIVPAEVSRGVIYIVRNPLDVAVSLVYYSGHPADEIIRRLGNQYETQSWAPDRVFTQTPQHLSTWSEHVIGWLDQCDIAVHVARYEDLLADTERELAAMCKFTGLAIEDSRIERAVAHSTFADLAAQEVASGFNDRPPTGSRFFRRGQAGGWRSELTARQVERIIDDHGEVMRRLGYLSPDGSLLDCGSDNR